MRLAFNWAAKMGLIASSPVRHFEKPRAGRRDVVVTPDEYAWMVSQVKDQEVRDLLSVYGGPAAARRRS